MKKLLVGLSLCLGIFSASAQITITTADIATPGQVLHQATDSFPTTIAIGTASATSQVWNMAALGQNAHDTLSFLNYSSAPNANFSSANLVIKEGWQNNYAYTINNSSSIQTLGLTGTLTLLGYPTAITDKDNASELLVNFPYTYNSTFTNNYRTYAKFPFGHNVTVSGFTVLIDSLRDHSTVKKTAIVDAFGTLTTPLGTYTVIRSKETKITHDTVDAYYAFPITPSWHLNAQTSADSTTIYNFWANGLGYILASATMDSTGAVKRVSWLQSAPVGVGIKEVTESNNELVFPNPAQNEINFVADASQQKAIQIFDVTGRLIDIITITNNQTTINTSNYANGMYRYNIIGKDNSILNKGKFTIINK